MRAGTTRLGATRTARLSPSMAAPAMVTVPGSVTSVRRSSGAFKCDPSNVTFQGNTVRVRNPMCAGTYAIEYTPASSPTPVVTTPPKPTTSIFDQPPSTPPTFGSGSTSSSSSSTGLAPTTPASTPTTTIEPVPADDPVPSTTSTSPAASSAAQPYYGGSNPYSPYMSIYGQQQPPVEPDDAPMIVPETGKPVGKKIAVGIGGAAVIGLLAWAILRRRRKR